MTFCVRNPGLATYQRFINIHPYCMFRNNPNVLDLVEGLTDKQFTVFRPSAFGRPRGVRPIM